MPKCKFVFKTAPLNPKFKHLNLETNEITTEEISEIIEVSEEGIKYV